MTWRGLGAVALLVTLALSGCIGGGDDGLETTTVPDQQAIPVLELLDPVGLPQDKSAAEPNIAVMDDGTVFVTAPVGASEQPNIAQGAAWLWRSTDDGQTWEVLRDPWIGDEETAPDVLGLDGAFCSCDADVVTSPDGWVYYTDWWIAGFAGPGNYLVEASPDGGETWQQAPVTIPHPTSVDRQWLIAGEDGFVGLFYSYFGTAPGLAQAQDTPYDRRAIQAVFSHDHGQTWSQPVDVVEDTQGNEAFQIAHPRLLADGTLIMPYGHVQVEEDFFTDPSQVRVAISEDQGESWEHVTVAQAPEGFENLWAVQGATDEAGNAYVAWAARTDETMTLFLSESQDGARTWTTPEAIDATGLNFLPWLTARGEGQVAVGWYGGNATGDPQEVDEDVAWFAYVAERANTTAPWAVAKADARPVKLGPLCPIGAACPEDRELLDYVSLAYAPDGQLHYSYARSSTATGGEIPALVHHVAEAR